MSKTFCNLEEISLVNIISISEQKLQNNFQTIMKFLNENSNRINLLESKMLFQQKVNTESIKEINQKNNRSYLFLKQLQQKSQSIQDNLLKLKNQQSKRINQAESAIQILNNQFKFHLEKVSNLDYQRQYEIESIQNQQKKCLDIINLKAEKSETQMDRVRKDIGQLIIKSEANIKKVKYIEQKIQSLETQNEINPFSNLISNGKPNQKYFDVLDKLSVQIKNLLISQFQKQNKNLPRLLKQKNYFSDQNSSKRSSILCSPIFNQQQQIKDLKQTVNQLKSKMQLMDLKGNQSLNKTFQKFNQDINQIKIIRNQFKRQSTRDKVDLSGNSILEKIQQLRPEINKICSRIDSIQDKIYSTEKRLEQNKKNTTELLNYVKQNNLSKYDQKIKSIQSQFFTQIKQINSRLETKTNNVDFLKFGHHTDQKLKQINQILITKCQKVEVKKALLFIESKIKQIILVISEDEENEKDALITKKNVKCISCDKQLDKYSGLISQQAKNWNMLPTKELQTENLGKFGITKFGSLAKKLKKLQGGQLPLLRSKKQNE